MATRCVPAPATACHRSRSGHPGSRTASGDRSATPEPGSGGDKDPCGEQRGGSRYNEIRQRRRPTLEAVVGGVDPGDGRVDGSGVVERAGDEGDGDGPHPSPAAVEIKTHAASTEGVAGAPGVGGITALLSVGRASLQPRLLVGVLALGGGERLAQGQQGETPAAGSSPEWLA
uniref:DUF834 domain-containing protein n=1 Tax=Oryza brachyantha TaxID=4533 RepID=J3L0V1_ORYBR